MKHKNEELTKICVTCAPLDNTVGYIIIEIKLQVLYESETLSLVLLSVRNSCDLL
jgi:hypothetical protein